MLLACATLIAVVLIDRGEWNWRIIAIVLAGAVIASGCLLTGIRLITNRKRFHGGLFSPVGLRAVGIFGLLICVAMMVVRPDDLVHLPHILVFVSLCFGLAHLRKIQASRDDSPQQDEEESELVKGRRQEWPR